MRKVLSIILIFMLIGCNGVADKFVIEQELPLRTCTIATLRNDIVKTGGVTIVNDVVVEGRVTSSDAEDNFYGSLFVEDESGALELVIGTPNLDAHFPEGLRVALRIKGCYADYRRGVMQIGNPAPEYEEYRVADLASPERVASVVVRSTDVEPITPYETTIAQLDRSMCGRLVRVCGLKLVDSSSIDTLAGESLDRAVWRGYSLFKDGVGDSIALYTRDYARYAKHRIVHDSVAITGILQWDKYREGDECYYLNMRYEADCALY